ncbi:16S rRNA (uracil(1498)-N(3))-methyltransferase [candidate division KSB1 bacterium]|nr:16S rRNA (uracil(1498)-N(3))-methyltransferase [candidate division KSB1 bacterium]
MDFQQFYVEPDNISTHVFRLTGDECRHAIKVLRKKRGDALSAIDGCGRLLHGIIERIERDQVVVSIERIEENVGEPRIKLTIAQAIPKGHYFDLVVEKGTEIGVSAFQPITTARSIVEPTSRIERWQKKALAATKQCGRSRCPTVASPLPFDAFLQRDQCDLAFIAHEAAEQAGPSPLALQGLRAITLYIGPEGGFTATEIERAKEFRVVPIHLGSRRLRSETAALVAATKILHAAGELG